jgi:hypothetical protein
MTGEFSNEILDQGNDFFGLFFLRHMTGLLDHNGSAAWQYLAHALGAFPRNYLIMFADDIQCRNLQIFKRLA